MQKSIDKIGWVPAEWPAPIWIKAGTTTRTGGVSLPPYDTFNLAQHVEDDNLHVLQNRELLRCELDLPTEPHWLSQTHDNGVINIQDDHAANKADGSYTKEPHSVCAILTADCLPLLLCNDQGTEIASVHIGWRGFSKDIIANTIVKFTVNPDQLMAWLGPCISTLHYEVGQEVYDACTTKFTEAKSAFIPSREVHWFADLRLMVTQRLIHHGIQKIYGDEYCTYTHADHFFSFRRDGKTGRMASLIWMDSLKT